MVCLLAFTTAPIKAQSSYNVSIIPVDKDTVFAKSVIEIRKTFQSRIQALEHVRKVPALLQSKGYISASIDSVVENEGEVFAYLFTGDQYQWSNISISNANKELLQQAGWKDPFKKSSFNFEQYQQAQQTLLNYFENNGYPFAKIQLDSFSIEGGTVKAALAFNKGPLYRIDSIRMFGPAKISRNFIHRYLNFPPAAIYRKDNLDRINQRLLELPYLEQSQPWDLTMLSTASILNLYLKPKKSNQVNVLAGFLPANQQLGGKLLFTVDANLQLKNAFGGGESIGLVWKQIQPQSPRLNLQYAQPYMFNSPYGVDFLFDLYKKDSTFLNINGQLGMLYMLSPNKTGKIFIQNQRTFVLQIDTFRIKTFKQLPDIADVSSLNLGLEYNINNTNYRFNPRSGNEAFISLTAGNKKIKKNTTVTQLKDPSFNYISLYDSVLQNTYLLRLRFGGAKYFPVGKQSVFKAGATAGWYQSANYYRNELFQIGGYRLLRGFDEESIFADQFAVGTVEYRYLIGINSYFFGFSDLGYTRNSIAKVSNGYGGAGVGLSFETKGGIFNISYAAGKRNDLPFNIRQSKIHIGFVSIF
ncbi:MAG: hypothetical protein JWQ96_3065 [Segetibacter sp.]|nr:hypothetical protein [Segetibacter sp.]